MAGTSAGAKLGWRTRRRNGNAHRSGGKMVHLADVRKQKRAMTVTEYRRRRASLAYELYQVQDDPSRRRSVRERLRALDRNKPLGA